MEKNFKNKTLVELLEILYDGAHSFHVHEVDNLIEEICFSTAKLFDLKCDFSVPDNLNIFASYELSSKTRYEGKDATIFVNTFPFPNYSHKYSTKELLAITDIVSSIFHVVSRTKQYKFYLDNIDVFLNNPDLYFYSDQHIITSFIHDEELQLSNIHTQNEPGFEYFFQYSEITAFTDQFTLTERFLDTLYEKTGKKLYYKAMEAYRKVTKKTMNINLKAAKKAYPQYNEDEIFDFLEEKSHLAGLEIADKIRKSRILKHPRIR